MKKNAVMMLVALVGLTACEKQMMDGADSSTIEYDESEQRVVLFDVQGDFGKEDFTRGGADMTRGSLQADGKQMTDLWVLDYQGGNLVQQIHQSGEDDDFGVPQMALDFGEHKLYFVCSRGKSAELSTSEHSVMWGTPSDTFWKELTLNVTTGSASTQSVTLQRVATRLRITINDEIPDGTSAVVITPVKWYYGLDYLTGGAIGEQQSDLPISLPESYAGRTGVSLSVYGMSGTSEWTTDVTVKAVDGDDNILGQAVIHSAPFKANRATSYGGSLFSGDGTFSIALDDSWESEHTGNW